MNQQVDFGAVGEVERLEGLQDAVLVDGADGLLSLRG